MARLLRRGGIENSRGPLPPPRTGSTSMTKRMIPLLAAAAVAVPAMIQAGEVRVGYTTDALTLDPHNHRNRTTQTIIRNMYDGLVTRAPGMKVVRM